MEGSEGTKKTSDIEIKLHSDSKNMSMNEKSYMPERVQVASDVKTTPDFHHRSRTVDLYINSQRRQILVPSADPCGT